MIQHRGKLSKGIGLFSVTAAATVVGMLMVTVLVVAFVAILVASINVFGGFTVTQRMLTMFTKG